MPPESRTAALTRKSRRGGGVIDDTHPTVRTRIDAIFAAMTPSERFGWKPEDYPNAQTIGERTLLIPLSAKLSDANVGDVIAAVRSALRAGTG